MVKEFMVCVQDPKAAPREGHIAVHPVVRVFNGNPTKYTSPTDLINSFKEDRVYKGAKYLYVAKTEVNESEWNWLQHELRQPTFSKSAFEVSAEFANRDLN